MRKDLLGCPLKMWCDKVSIQKPMAPSLLCWGSVGWEGTPAPLSVTLCELVSVPPWDPCLVCPQPPPWSHCGDPSWSLILLLHGNQRRA